ncbi:MAG: hypothetical protein AAFP70_20690, partial [Calditrichota bacterium]
MKITTIILTLLVFGSTFLVYAQERPEVIDAYLNEPYGDNLFRRKGIMDGNQIRTQYFNQGEV